MKKYLQGFRIYLLQLLNGVSYETHCKELQQLEMIYENKVKEKLYHLDLQADYNDIAIKALENKLKGYEKQIATTSKYIEILNQVMADDYEQLWTNYRIIAVID